MSSEEDLGDDRDTNCEDFTQNWPENFDTTVSDTDEEIETPNNLFYIGKDGTLNGM